MRQVAKNVMEYTCQVPLIYHYDALLESCIGSILKHKIPYENYVPDEINV